jgi:ribose transport system ATP-binding protein
MAMSAALLDAPSDSVTVLEARGICRSFPGVRALDDVSLRVRRGAVHALLGENGAGKSTLMNIFAGVLRADAGELLLDGHPVSFGGPGEARAAGVATVFQELQLVSQLTVAQNIFLGREPSTRAGWIDDAQMNRDARRWMERLKLDVAPDVRVGDLRVGQQQLVEIARALSMDARVIILDEPTSATTQREAAALHGLLRELAGSGVAIIYITHKLDELSALADDLTVLRDGRCIASLPAASASHDDIVRMMVGRGLSQAFTRHAVAAGEEILRVEGLCLNHRERDRDRVVNDVSLSLRRGEVLGIFGLMGAGRTELLEALFGLHPKRAHGKLFVAGSEVVLGSPREALEAGLALVPEDRKRDGLVLSFGVVANASLACLDRLYPSGWINPSSEHDLVAGYARRLKLRAPLLAKRARNLSGGNQQKVVLAKCLATRPKVLLLDEPTRGIDIGAKHEIYALLDELSASGLGVIVVSSELPELLGLADRLLVMSEGRMTAEFSRAQANERDIMNAALPRSARYGDELA